MHLHAAARRPRRARTTSTLLVADRHAVDDPHRAVGGLELGLEHERAVGGSAAGWRCAARRGGDQPAAVVVRRRGAPRSRRPSRSGGRRASRSSRRRPTRAAVWVSPMSAYCSIRDAISRRHVGVRALPPGPSVTCTNISRSWASASRSASACVAEAVAQAVDERGHRVDGEPGLRRGRLGAVRPRASGAAPRAAGARRRGWRRCRRPGSRRARPGPAGAPRAAPASSAVSGPPAAGSAGSPAPGGSSARGSCSPEGVQRLLTLVSCARPSGHDRQSGKWDLGRIEAPEPPPGRQSMPGAPGPHRRAAPSGVVASDGGCFPRPPSSRSGPRPEEQSPDEREVIT